MYGVVGIRLTSNGANLCFVPPDWNYSKGSLRFDYASCEREQPAFGKIEILSRLEVQSYLKAVDQVVKFVKKSETLAVAMEKYFSKEVSQRFISKVEFGGILRSQMLLACKTYVIPMAVSSSRSFLVGGMKVQDQKKQVESFLRKNGIVFDDDDEMNAFVVAFHWYCKINGVGNKFLPQMTLF